MVAFFVGRFLGDGLLEGERTKGIIQRYTDRLRENSFSTVLIMRFIFLPYDLVNYLCGVLRIDWKAFLFATSIGSLPGTSRSSWLVRRLRATCHRGFRVSIRVYSRYPWCF